MSAETQFRKCASPCDRFVTPQDSHALCVACLGEKHAVAALEGGVCPHCMHLSLATLRSRRALFVDGAFASVPRGAGPAATEADRRLHSWGSQLDLMEGMETGDPLSPSQHRSVSASGTEAPLVVTFPRDQPSTRHSSSSEEVDVVTSRLDERVLRSQAPPSRRSLPFFPDLHTEVCRSWKNPFSARLYIPASDYYGNVAGLMEKGYKRMPPVEQTLASHLSSVETSSLKAPSLPTKPLRVTSALDRVCLMDAPLAPSGLFGEVVNTVVERHQEARKQSAAFQSVLPRRSLAQGAAGQKQQAPKTTSAFRSSQKHSVAARVPPRGRALSGMCLSRAGVRASPEGVAPAVYSGPLWRARGVGTTAALSTRGQSRETGSLSRVFGDVVTSTKYISMGPEHYKKRLLYSVQTSAASFQRRSYHRGGVGSGSGIGTGSHHSSEQGHHRVGATFAERVGVLQPVLRSSEKGWRAEAHSRSQATEPLSQSAEVQHAHIKTDHASNPVLGLVCHDRSKKRLLSCSDPSFTQEVPEFCFRERSLSISGPSLQFGTLTPDIYIGSSCSLSSVAVSGRSHSQLPRRLADSRPVTERGGQASRCRPHSLRTAGVKTQCQEKRAFSGSENHLSGHSLGFGHDAGTIVFRSSRYDSHSSQKSARGPVTDSHIFSRTVGSNGSSFQRDSSGLAVHETPAVVAQKQKVFPEGKSFSYDQGLPMMCASLGYVEKPGISKFRYCLEMLAVFQALRCFLPDLKHRHVLVRTDNMATVSHIIRQGGLRSRPLYKLARQILLWSQAKYGSRHPVETGAEFRGMETASRCRAANLDGLLSSRGRPLRDSGECAMSPLVLSSSSSSSGAGRYGTDLAEASSVRLSPGGSAPRSSGKSPPGCGQPTASSAILAGPSLVYEPNFPPRRLSVGDSDLEGPSLSGRGLGLAPSPRVVEPVGLASEGAQLIASGLSAEVVQTILQSRAPSTRKLYALRWKLFTSWCTSRQQDPVNCPIGTVLEFLQARLATGLSHSTLKVYVAAISAFHSPLDGHSVVVLDSLCRAPFEPLDQVPDRLLTIKTAVLLALASLKRVGDLQALSVAPSCIDFAPGLAKVFLFPRAGYVPKVPFVPPQPIVLQAFCPPPFREADQERLHCLCPVRALDTYIRRTTLWRKSDQLLVCFGPPRRGLPASRQTLSRWIVDAISTSYGSSGLPSLMGVRAHSTRGVAASKAFLAGVSVLDICKAAGWSSPLTFVRFYGLDLPATPGSVVLVP
ncbi:hypothetical protein M9458_052923 [Cirrhinus mrigala]|uniref:Core-binding (CB) domain-containing protein n=1 Tax=Cirrhinus mrigala TaxID=683832 RepID=A0ABD0MNV8_CIRMR